MDEIHEDGHGPSGHDSAKAKAPAAKRKRAIAIGVVAAVIVAAIGGFRRLARAADILQRDLPYADGLVRGELLQR